MRLSKLLREAQIAFSNELADVEIEGISSDSRTVRRGEIFVALRGLSQDGFCHIAEARRRGAVLVLAEREAEGCPCLVVSDARAALAQLFDAWYGHPARGMKLVGITGTNGKTSTAAMLFAILRAAGYDCGLIGTVECRFNEEVLSLANADALANMTTPDPSELYALLAELRARGATHTVMEVTSHALTFSKVAPLHFARAVFTNLTPDHLDLHGDMESYFAEKRKLFSQCDEAVVSCFGDYGMRLSDTLELPVRTVSPQTVRNVQKQGADGVCFTLMSESAPLSLSLPIPGDFSVENGALAATTALSLGVAHCTVKEALSAFGGVKGRIERVGENRLGVSVFLDYAHTPDALEKLLCCVRGFRAPEQRIVLLFGCGGDRDRTKRAEMGRVASRLADFLILTSDNCRSERPEDILHDILKGVDKERPYKILPDRREAIAYAVAHARRGDILLLAGKGHEEYEIRGRARIPFSERDIVCECIRAREEANDAD
ncbi:MAG: UDP-N-acetylmuramoyl-L-alanyl-D-glutamate--2,6-diaminopimelate ligase [Clostridia bacterium]|nr:UDP-N-acetylmuramoyl-L-alanyl-D-glutamate--2,6-diaminopimelate ligase [Clostridia bacterium]